MSNKGPLIAIAAACVATAATSVAVAGPPHRPAGKLVVGIVYAGGPHRADADSSLHGGHVTLLRRGATLRERDVRRGHRARFSLQPGDVRVEVTSGDARCRSTHVTIASNETRRRTITCSVR